MKILPKYTLIAASLILALVALPSSTNADAWNKKTILTVHEPIQVPGAVLDPGTYVMELANVLPRNIVHVKNEREDEVLTTFIAVHDVNMNPEGDTLLEMEEMPFGNPVAVKSWFYPGREIGLEFVYPDDQFLIAQAWRETNTALAVVEAPEPEPAEIEGTLAEARQEPVVKEPEPEITLEKPTPVEEEPMVEEEEETVIAEEPETTTEEQPSTLPATASHLPLVGLMGLISLSAGLGLRMRSSRRHLRQ